MADLSALPGTGGIRAFVLGENSSGLKNAVYIVTELCGASCRHRGCRTSGRLKNGYLRSLRESIRQIIRSLDRWRQPCFRQLRMCYTRAGTCMQSLRLPHCRTRSRRPGRRDFLFGKLRQAGRCQRTARSLMTALLPKAAESSTITACERRWGTIYPRPWYFYGSADSGCHVDTPQQHNRQGACDHTSNGCD